MQQVEDLLIGQGVDFIPEQDPLGERSPFVQRFLNETNLQQYLPDIARKLMGAGEVLAWLRITPGGYRLRYYIKDDFKPYYSPDSDDLTAATILSSYTVELPDGGVQRKWLKMVVLRQGTFVEESDSRPRMAGIGDRVDLDLSQSHQLMEGDKPQGLGNEVRFYPNPFEFLPLVVLKNKPTGPGQRGADDFSEFAKQLVSHDATMQAIGRNVRKYARQTIFTNLPRAQIMKGSQGEGDRRYGNSGTYASGYYDAQQSAARRGGGMPGQEEEIADVIGADSMPGESFINVLTWNPIQSDQLRYLEILEDKLHWSMGSISKRGGNTAYEVRANLSWPTATANKKAHNLFDRGLCELIAGAIAMRSASIR